MDDARDEDDAALRVQLEVRLDRQPISGRLRTPLGAEEPFVGWLGFVEALKRVQESSASHNPPDAE
jgi:hypothetical protein